MKKNTKEFQAGNFLHLRVAHPKNYLFRLKCNNHQRGNIKINDIKKKPVLKGFKTFIALAQSFWTLCFVIS